SFFFFLHTTSPYIYTSLHILIFFFFFLMRREPQTSTQQGTLFPYTTLFRSRMSLRASSWPSSASHSARTGWPSVLARSEEHTSELQSRLVISYAVFCLNKKTILILVWVITFALYCFHSLAARQNKW